MNNFYKETPILDLILFSVLIYENFLSSSKKPKMGGKLMKYIKQNEENVKNYIKHSNNTILKNAIYTSTDSNFNKLKSVNKFEENLSFRINIQK